MNKAVDNFFLNAKRWKIEFQILRELVTAEVELVEELKWNHPCYTLNGKNVIIIHGFKKYCALLFHKGALMKDPEKILIKQTEHVQSGRQLRFTSLDEIVDKREWISAYIKEAIEIEKSGAKVKLKTVADYEMPIEFEQALKEDEKLASAFNNLTPGRQKAYIIYFGEAKRSETRKNRVAKYCDFIKEGKGMDD
ncbi:YdeI/OmpD-associated family protein [Pedobacter flavus]|uniref:DUF1801 domain-containing protein n=1 Tax=Pedobacter flavus TaxID=3113906 RepID=A0ABU7H3I2_9SPHI|nr:DUF1801 domain-containing protein [Pedobacter sp. VNH31]MEE1885898.1 DUF1801 domain-containing protein [Pedobacter sp. VNH31]